MALGVHFGLDTSNYTTSAAGVSPAGEVFCAKRPLAVPQGDRGMRQSDALFCHTRDLPEVVAECLEAAAGRSVLSVGASETPRRVEGSYMPCFLAGVNAAKCAAALLGVPYLGFSHQEGHIEAARFGALLEGRELCGEAFLALHLSGGTTELLLVREDGFRYRTELLFDTLDLTCGQLIDRCGVALGLPFPAGAHLEALALKSEKRYRVRVPRKDTGINLSGFENQFRRRMQEGERPEDLARFVFDAVIAAVTALLEAAGRESLPVLFSGGVSSSAILRGHFSSERYFFAPPALSADNAVGIARLAGKGV
ncbi:MAG: hypothetical protein IKC69_06510 [Clostridia bacterium]|nr:hypothetical protein [Clostridia bacterium]